MSNELLLTAGAALLGGLVAGLAAVAFARRRAAAADPGALALRHALELSDQGFVVFDAELRLLAWNRTYGEIFRLPDELLRVGTPLELLVRSNAERGVYGIGDIEHLVAVRVAQLRASTLGARMLAGPLGRILEMRSARLSDGSLFFTYTDATQIVTSAEQLEAQNLTLERRVAERTDELHRLNLELARAKAEAEDANVSKSRFLAAASHDLLQPLSAARLYTTSLRERLRGAAHADQAVLAANIDESLESVEDILSALLEISHLDAGATRTEVTSFPLSDLMRQLQTEFEPLAQSRGLRLRFVRSSQRITSDRKLLRRMLQNLVANAIKYTRDGGVLIGARRRGDTIRIDVCDTGIGIPDGKQQVIFREFERLPAGAATSGGAGLGLSIVERLSRVLKHDVGLLSREGRGSRFSVTVPRAEAALPGVAGAVVSGSVPPRQRSLQGLVVAAVDNETQILSGLRLLLQGWDCTVAEGASLAEVEDALSALGRPPDVIVADFHIGDQTGLDVVRALRARHGVCPAVLVTADRDPAIRSTANAEDVRTLYKPLKPAALRSLLAQYQLVRGARDTVAATTPDPAYARPQQHEAND